MKIKQIRENVMDNNSKQEEVRCALEAYENERKQKLNRTIVEKDYKAQRNKLQKIEERKRVIDLHNAKMEEAKRRKAAIREEEEELRRSIKEKSLMKQQHFDLMKEKQAEIQNLKTHYAIKWQNQKPIRIENPYLIVERKIASSNMAYRHERSISQYS